MPSSLASAQAASVRRSLGLLPADCLRIAFAIVLMEDVIHLYAHRSLFLATGAWPWVPVGPICILWMTSLLGVLRNIRFFSLINWLCCAFMLGLVAPNDGFQQAACDSIVIGISLLVFVLPNIRLYHHHWVLAAYLSSIYVDSAVHKLLSPMWSHGFGLAAPMTFPSLVWANTGWTSILPAWLWHASGYCVVGFELVFPVLYVFRTTRLTALLIGTALHLGIGIIYPIPVFAGVMLSLYFALLVEWRRLKSAPLPQITPRLALVFALWLLAVANAYYPVSKAARKAVYMATGIASHAVFEDDGFKGYGYQLRLLALDNRMITYSRGDLFAFDIRDRVWELWWKRTQAPPLLVRDAERHLAAWIPDARVQARPQQVLLDNIDTRLFAVNNAVPWRDVGRIEHGQVYWDGSSDPNQQLGALIKGLLR